MWPQLNEISQRLPIIPEAETVGAKPPGLRHALGPISDIGLTW